MSFVLLEKLCWCLSIIVALTLISSFEIWITHKSDVEVTFFFGGICQLAENIERHHSLLISLFASKDVIYPCVQIVGHILGFNAFSHNLHKLECVLISPCRQHDVIDFSSILFLSKVALVVIDKHLRQEVELRSELTNISEVGQSILEWLVKGSKDSLRVVQSATMKLNVCFNIRCKTRQVVQNDARVAVVRSTVESVVKTNEWLSIVVLSFEFSLPLSWA